MALEEDRESGSWSERSVCMGNKTTCSFPGLINHHHKFIISFAEDQFCESSTRKVQDKSPSCEGEGETGSVYPPGM
ncbi:hypothetical protein JZ751_003653 [Albula glossodonta]|uniref:Uncharacterized protein n=1 Tax=Albula glossodonta TaxID=121402 RepID=A0A8T2NAM5_9TELE|nr:hypothetical protein JZ751_003653 [Albula glossodonta]